MSKSTLTRSTRSGGSRWLTSTEACARLGVRAQTLYAYVSRGLLHPRRDERRSLYDRNELDALAASGRRRSRRGRLEVLIDTEITLLDPGGRLAYRGVDVADLVGRWSFERVAEWLWTGQDDGEPPPWPTAPGGPATGDRPSDRVRVAAAVTAATASAADRDLGRVADIGRELIPALVSALPFVGEPCPEVAPTIAERVWPRLTTLRPTPARLRALDAALVLLADHELASSTVTARVAASVWSPPLDVVVAALATHAGALHGGAMTPIEDQLRADGRATMGRDHPLYREAGDPRARLLLPLALAAAPARRRPMVAAAGDPGEGPPTIDLVLPALAVATDMIPGASEALFAIARTAGWLAHAGEEYGNPLRFRPRASYTGTPPLPRPTGS
jgi:citrate synthase